jgi:hypothetical protein
LNKGAESIVIIDEKYNEQFQAYHDNNFKDFKGRKADDLVKEFGQYGVTYDAAGMKAVSIPSNQFQEIKWIKPLNYSPKPSNPFGMSVW